MANKIKGLTIEIGGETTKLVKSMGEVNKHSKDLSSELKQVDRLLKLDPKNTELIAQKQKILADSVTTTKDKLEQLKEAEKQVQEQVKKGEASEEQYRALQREIIKTEEELKKVEKAAKDFGGNLTQSLKNAGEDMKAFGGKVSDAGNKMMPLSTAAAGALGGIVALGVKAGQSADEINTLSKQTGLSTEEIQKFQYASERIDVPLETLTGSMAKLTKNMGMAKGGTGAAADAFKQLGVNVKDDLTGELKNNQEVFDEVIQKLGEVANETERDSIAMEIFGRSAQDLNPLILGGADALKQLGDEAAEAGLILSQEALDSANEFNDSIDKLKATATGSFAALGTEIANMLTPMIEDLAVVVEGALEWIRNLDEGQIKMITTIIAVVATIGPLLVIIGKVITVVGTITSALPVLGAAFTALAGPIGIAIAAVAAIIAIGVALYKNWDEIKAAAKQLWENIKQRFNEIKEAITKPINDAMDTIRNINLYDVGKNIISGLINGVKAMVGKVKDAIGSVVDTVTGGVKRALRIESPSKVMEEMGGNVSEGFAVGIKKNLMNVQRQANDMSMAAVTGADAQPGGVSGGSIMHSGTIRVEGVNNAGDLTAVVDIVMDQLRREVRT
jgi:phage-related minor tail protein